MPKGKLNLQSSPQESKKEFRYDYMMWRRVQAVARNVYRQRTGVNASWGDVNYSWSELTTHVISSAIADLEEEMKQKKLIPEHVTENPVKKLGAFVFFRFRREQIRYHQKQKKDEGHRAMQILQQPDIGEAATQLYTGDNSSQVSLPPLTEEEHQEIMDWFAVPENDALFGPPPPPLDD